MGENLETAYYLRWQKIDPNPHQINSADTIAAADVNVNAGADIDVNVNVYAHVNTDVNADVNVKVNLYCTSVVDDSRCNEGESRVDHQDNY